MSTPAIAKTIADPRGHVDYDEHGSGPTLVLVPGSCSTGAAWRAVVAEWRDRFRCVTTSLLGYGGTAERRTAGDAGIAHEADVVEAVVRRAGGPVHLVGHSFGGLAAVAVALRRRVPLLSLTVVEAPAVDLLRYAGETAHYLTVRAMTAEYIAAFRAGAPAAIAAVMDFYGGTGTFAAWPERVRQYAIATTAANVLDWEAAYGFPLTAAGLASIAAPSLLVWGTESPPAIRRANDLLGRYMDAERVALDGASHFALATHPAETARLIARHVQLSEVRSQLAS